MTAAPPLRIFIAHPSPVLTDHRANGDGLVAFGFIRRLVERGHELHVAAQCVMLRDPVPSNLHVYDLNGRYEMSAFDRLRFMVRMRQLFDRLRREMRFDLVHQMNPVLTGLSLSLVGIPEPLVLGTYVPRWNGSADEESQRATGGLLRKTVRNTICRLQQTQAAGLLIATPQARSRLWRPELQEQRIYDVPHGIDLDRFPIRQTIPDRPSVLFLAGVGRRKGILTLVDAWERVDQALPGTKLVIGGPDGGVLNEVRDRVSAMPYCNIQIIGDVKRDDVPELMRTHSVYCLPSYGEPYATSVLEAMACGVPVVATNAGGIPDMLPKDGGRLVPPRDPAALAAALIEILQSRDLQEQMGRRNRAHVEREYDVERVVDRLESAYRDILGRTHTSSPRAGAMSWAVDAPSEANDTSGPAHRTPARTEKSW